MSVADPEKDIARSLHLALRAEGVCGALVFSFLDDADTGTRVTIESKLHKVRHELYVKQTTEVGWVESAAQAFAAKQREAL